VAKKLCINPNDDHWILRQEAAECFAKVCRIYNDQYSTLKPRCIKLLTQQALRLDRPLSTQYGGIVAISLFGPRAVDAFLLPLAKKYWMTWEAELKEVMAFRCKRNMIKEYELHMCQQALLVSCLSVLVFYI
jgi:transcription initiation factor TFIID subunit 6